MIDDAISGGPAVAKAMAGRQTGGEGRIEDTELLRRYAEDRTEEAFAEFVRRHINLVYSAALRRTGGDAPAAADVAQHVFLAAARNVRSLARHPRLTGWLYAATRNAAINLMRDEHRRRLRERMAQAAGELLATPAHDAEWERLRPVLDDAMDQLGDRDREAVLLRFFEGRPLADIGARLHLTENAARMRVERALEKLRALLARRGLTSTGAALGAVLANQAVVAAPATLASSVSGAALAGGGQFAAAGLLGFMSMNKIWTTIVAAVVLTTATTVIYEVRASHATQSALEATRREHSALLRRVAEAEKRAIASQAEDLPVRSVANKPPPPPPTRDPAALGNELMAANPELRGLLAAEAKAGIAARFFPLYRALNLSEAQISEFEEIMINGHTRRESGVRGVPGVGDVTFEVAPSMSATEKDQRLRQLLGDAGVQQLREYQGLLMGTVSKLAGALYFTDTPLTTEQGWQLARVMKAVGRSGKIVRGQTTPAEYWTMIVDQSAELLSDPQRAALAGLQKNDEYQWAKDQATRSQAAGTTPGK